MQFHAPVKGLAIDHKNQDQGDGDAQQQSDGRADGAEQGAFDAQQFRDLASAQAQMAQHAELAAPRPGLCGKGRADPGQADQNRRHFQGVSNGEAAIEHRQRNLADVGRLGDIQPRGLRQGADRGDHCGFFGSGRKRNGDVVDARIAGPAEIVGAIDDDGAVAARIVAPDAADDCPTRHAFDRQADRHAGNKTIQIGDRLGYPDRRQILLRQHRIIGAAQQR